MRRFHRDGETTSPAASFFSHSVFDRWSADFVGCGGLAVYDFTAYNQRRFPALDKENVRLRRVEFGFAGGFAVGNLECGIPGTGEYLAGELVFVHLGGQGFREPFQFGGLPHAEAAGSPAGNAKPAVINVIAMSLMPETVSHRGVRD